MLKNEFYFPSADGKTNIHVIEWIPDGEIRAVLQICHGMVEYIDRYDEFATCLTAHGYYVVGHDHLGHGLSVAGADRLGFFAETNGNECVISDIHTLRLMTQKKYTKLPYFMLGHSMGSFLLRQYLGVHGDHLSGAIIMGTGQKPDCLLIAGKLLCKCMAAWKGWNYRSRLIDQMAFGGFNRRFAHETNGATWLSRNPVNAKKYAKDPLCSFMFTVNAYYHMFCGIQKVNRQERACMIPKELPVFFVAGSDDPVGNFGKAVENVYKMYQQCGLQQVQMKLYDQDRHEILNEIDRKLVFADLLQWLEARML